MPKIKSRDVAITMDMAGCPNRCKHCWLGHTPNRKVKENVIREVVEQFRSWSIKGESEPFFNNITVNTWYREPDYLDNYKELWELEKELSDKPMRFELLSIWRLARDEEYAKWAKDIGTEACQITFFGMEENTDYFAGRKGAFKDNLTATKRLLDVGIIPRWQLFINEKNRKELHEFVELIKTLELEEKTHKLGTEFSCFAHIPAPDGKAFELEGIRPKQDIIFDIPDYLKEKTTKHFKVDTFDEVIGKPEKELLPELLQQDSPNGDYPNLAFMVTPELDVYSNIGEPMKWWCLGNLNKDGIEEIMDRFINDKIPGFHVNFNIPVSELARKYGRQDSEYMYTKDDLIRRWMRMWGEELKL